jgi:uncharacterized protein YlxW (UPF0749 family)
MQKAVVQTKIKLAMTMIENENLKSTVQKLQQEIIQLTKQLNSMEPRVNFPFLFFSFYPLLFKWISV